jgi:hypothetical protein
MLLHALAARRETKQNESKRYAYEVLTSTLPVLLLNGLLAVLPFVLQALSEHYEDVKYFSEIQTLVLSRYYTLQARLQHVLSRRAAAAAAAAAAR